LKHAHLLICSATVLLLALAAAGFADSRDWSLLDTKGETFKLSEAQPAAPTLLIFWATWCAPCKKELSDYQKDLQALSDKGLRIILVAVDDVKTQSRVKPYVDSKGFKWRVLLDTSREVLRRYGGNNVPFTVLLDSDNKTVKVYQSGIRDLKALTTQVNSLLGGSSE
jgi:peroxiredoxin